MPGSGTDSTLTTYRDCLDQISRPDFVYSTQVHRVLKSVSLSIKADGRVVGVCTHRGQTLLHLLCKPLLTSCCSEDYLISLNNLTRLFVLNGGNINAQDIEGHTALHYAVSSAHHEVVQNLLKEKASPNEASVNLGNTALHDACSAWKAVDTRRDLSYLVRSAATLNSALVMSVDLLLRHRADPHTQNQCGETALHKAAKSGATKIAKTLLDRGGRVNTPDLRGNTPLHSLYTNYSPATACSGMEQLLLSHGANINQPNRQGTVAFCLVFSPVQASTPANITPGLLLQICCGLDIKVVNPTVASPQIRNIGYGHTDHRGLSCDLVTLLYQAGYTLEGLRGCGEGTCGQEHRDNLLDTLVVTPLSLARAAANLVRVCLKPNALVAVATLNLPSQIKDYILLKDVTCGLVSIPHVA